MNVPDANPGAAGELLAAAAQSEGDHGEPRRPASPGAAPALPEEIPAHLRYFTKFVAIPLLALATAGFGCVSLICGLWDRSGRQQHFVARMWAATVLRITLSPVRIVGEEKLRRYRVAVYASNHLSYMDTPVLFAKLPFQFRILAKQSLWKIPFVGWYLERSGQVPIDQGSSRSAVAGLLRGVAALKAGMPLVLFPEGSRSPDGHLHKWAPGCAFMALRAGVPLIPLALVGTYELLPIHVYHLRPRPLMIIVGEPISTEGLTTRDADALTERLYAEIAKMYYEYGEIAPKTATKEAGTLP
ncbi:MAG: lysophospholipid acyltransferase family protein [Acidobacteriaceae bacterium]|jgi:1-acyl-sn-glycerol-3-phosphate acyltransferase